MIAAWRLARDLGRSRAIARDIAEALDRTRGAIARDPVDARDRPRYLAHRLVEALDCADVNLADVNLVFTLGRAHELLSDLVQAVDLDRARGDFGFARDLARDLVGDLNLASARALRNRGSIRARRSRRAACVVPSAAGLLAAAARLLPAADRTRYAEEYLSELWDLAQSGAGRLRQLGYALRQLRSGLSVGFALRSPRRSGAAP